MSMNKRSSTDGIVDEAESPMESPPPSKRLKIFASGQSQISSSGNKKMTMISPENGQFTPQSDEHPPADEADLSSPSEGVRTPANEAEL